MQGNGYPLSDRAAFYYVALFRAVRDLLKVFIPSNPTWIKRPKEESHRLAFDSETVYNLFLLHSNAMAEAVGRIPEEEVNPPEAEILLGDSTNLPLTDKSVDYILASPPYCTRIDYAVATMPELAVLNFDPRGSFRTLREQLIGNTTVPHEVEAPSPSWGRLCADFLAKIQTHTSKASATYYYKSHWQYFYGLFASLKEIVRVLADNGRCVLVVQDSYYKDVHNNLPTIVEEMLIGLGMVREDRSDFASRSLMANINPRIKRYRASARAIESVVQLRKVDHGE